MVHRFATYRVMTAAATLALMAATTAGVAAIRHLAAEEVLRAGQTASRNWQLYQYLRSLRSLNELGLDLLTAAGSDAARHHEQQMRSMDARSKVAQEQAAQADERREALRSKLFRLRFSQAILEIGVVLAAVALASRRPLVWFIALAGFALGVGMAAMAYQI